MRPDELEPMSPAMRALLEAEQPLDVVPSATRAKLFAKVSASVAGAAAVGGAVSGASALGGKAAAGSVAATTAVTTKVLVVAAVAFSVGGGVGAGVHAVVVQPQQRVQPAPIVIRMEAPPVAVPPEPVVVPAPVPAPLPVPVPVKVLAPPKRPDNLGAERSYIEQARAALSRHEAAAALAALLQHEREYPAGQLAEERVALQVIALSESGEAAKARELDRKSTRLNSSHVKRSRMPSSA